MRLAIRQALTDESGAVAVDWVVLTGAMAAMAVIMMSTMNGETTSVANEIEVVLTDVSVAPLSDIGYSQ
jgi:Flp pilus assembly pilin Flp